MIKILKYGNVPNSEIFARENIAADVEGIVAEIVENVVNNGDKALFEYNKRFDGADVTTLEVTQEAQKLLATSEQALAKCGKQIDKAEKKQVKADIAALRKILFKTKPANLTEGQITDIRSAMNVLEGSSSHVRALAGE